MKKQQCSTCICWKVSQVRDIEGFCRRFPPRQTGDPTTEDRFPLTRFDAWCGEYKGGAIKATKVKK